MSTAEQPSLNRPLIGGIAALALAMGVGRFAYTPILPSMQQSAGFGSDLAGLLASLNHLGYFLGAFAAGAIPRGRARTLALRGCLLASLITTAAMALAETMVPWGLFRFVSGLASAGIFVLAAGTILDALTRQGRPQLSGVLFSGVGLGIVLSGLAVLLLDPLVGWRGDWLGLALASAALALPAWLWLGDREPAQQAAAAAPAPAALAYPLIFLILAYFCEGAGYIVSGTFLGAIVQALPGMAAYGELAWVVVGLAAAPSCLLWAWIAQRAGFVAALIAAHLVQAAGIVLPLLSADHFAVLGAALLFGGTFMGITTLAVSFGGQIAPANRGRVVGYVTAAFGLGQIIGPVVAGAMAERSGNFEGALIAAAVTVTVGAALLAVGQAATARLSRAPCAAAGCEAPARPGEAET